MALNFDFKPGAQTQPRTPVAPVPVPVEVPIQTGQPTAGPAPSQLSFDDFMAPATPVAPQAQNQQPANFAQAPLAQPRLDLSLFDRAAMPQANAAPVVTPVAPAELPPVVRENEPQARTGFNPAPWADQRAATNAMMVGLDNRERAEIGFDPAVPNIEIPSTLQAQPVEPTEPPQQTAHPVVAAAAKVEAEANVPVQTELPDGRPASMEPPQEPPRATTTLSQRIAKALKMQSEKMKSVFGKWPGTAVSAVLTGDPKVKIQEASVSAQVLLQAYRHQPETMLRELMASSVDHERMILEDKYAIERIVKFFNRNTITGVCEKSPVTTESDAHLRVIRAHDGPGVKVHPIVHTMWNADFDGDMMKVSFDPKAKEGVKSAMDFLIGTDGKNKIDPEWFGLVNWGDGSKDARKILQDMFNKGAGRQLNLTAEEITKLGDALELAWSGKEDAGFRQLLMRTRMIGDRQSPELRDYVTARVLTDIYRMNTEIRLSMFPVQVMWRYVRPMIEDIKMSMEATDRLAEELQHHIIPGTPAPNDYAYSESVGGPIATVDGKNPHFRFFGNVIKLSKASDAYFDYSPRSNLYVVTSETHQARNMAGLASIEEATRGIAEDARQRVWLAAGMPPLESDAALQTWLLEKFVYQYNFIAISVNSAVANWGLDGSIIGYESVSLPYIRTDSEEEMRKGIRTEFLKIYGKFTMEKLFGTHAPAGWEEVRLAEYVERNRANQAALGKPTTKFDTIDHFIGRLADLRTSFSKKFHDFLKEEALPGLMSKSGTHTEFADMLRRRENAIAKGMPSAADADLQTLAKAFFLLNKDVFYAMGLHNAEAFINSELGRKFVDATTPSWLGGAVYEAVARYRYEPVRLAEERIKRALETNDNGELHNAVIEREGQLNRLASSSDVWFGIVAAYREGADVFDGVLFARKTWLQKNTILNRLARNVPGGRPQHKEEEVAYGLFADPQGVYSGTRFTDYRGHNTLLDSLKDSTKEMKRYAGSNWDYGFESVKKAKKAFEADPEGKGKLTAALQVVAREPNALIDLTPWSMVDAAINLAKSFASSEKAQTEDALAFIYAQISYMRNGGIHSDLTVGGDFALGGISLERFQSSPYFVARILTDPKFSIWVYSGTGRTLMNTKAVLGTETPTEEQMWAWLLRNPRAAMALRKHSVKNGINNKTGFSYLTATKSLNDTLQELSTKRYTGPVMFDRTIKLMADHPGFYAILNLSVSMAGKKRLQVRSEMNETFNDVVGLLRGMHAWRGNALEFVERVAKARGIENFDQIIQAYRDGLELDPKGTVSGMTRDEYLAEHPDGQAVFDAARSGRVSVANAPISDIRYLGDYQRGQVFYQLAVFLEKYSIELEKAGIKKGKAADPEDAADFLHLDDNVTLRSFNDVIQSLSGAKISQSTSMNGADSKGLAAMMVMAHHTPDPCLGPDPKSMPTDYFIDNWFDFTDRRAEVLNPDGEKEYLPVNERNLDRILASATEEGVLIEDPAMCVATPCACARHASNDPSTNFRMNQTSSIGRFLTVIRSLSTEGLNLKVKTLGNDGTDSVTKFYVPDMLGMEAEDKVNEAYLLHPGDPVIAMAFARVELAGILQKAFKDMGYTDELQFGDFVNIAQILIRPVTAAPDAENAGQPVGVKVLQFGFANAIITEAMNKVGDNITMEEYVTIAVEALESDAVNGELTPESIMAGVRIHPEKPFNTSGITDKRMSAVERNVLGMYEILKNQDRPVKSLTDYELDQREAKLLTEYPFIAETWGEIGKFVERWAGDAEKEIKPRWGDNRFMHRIVGVAPASGQSLAYDAFGPKNSWVISAKSPNFVGAMVEAYNRGVNILLQDVIEENPELNQKEVFPTAKQWQEVYDRTGGALDQYQGIPAYMPDNGMDVDNKEERRVGTFIPTFDIRLNGGNTTIIGGAHDAGTFRAPVSRLSFIAETVANEFGLSDSEIAACKSFVEGLTFKITGTYGYKAAVAFAGLLQYQEEIDPAGVRQAPHVEMCKYSDIMDNIMRPAFDENADPDDVAQIDLGIIVDEGSPADKRLREGVARYYSRIDEVDKDTGLLPSGEPDEIIGWLVADWGNERRYHPIRLFENDNSSGAPAQFTVTSAIFNKATQALEIEWENSGDMSGRAFKIFEDLSAGNKFIARPVAIDDIELANGVKLGGLISRLSTVSRRLFQRRSQLMTTLIYMARIDPYGYNLAESDKVLTNPIYADLKAGLLDGSADVGVWIGAMFNDANEEVDIEFFPDEADADLNAFANYVTREAIKYNVNPSDFFASRYNGVPSEIWFNYQILFDDSSTYQAMLMKFMNRMMPSLCPPGIEDTGDTLFNANLQMLRPVAYTDIDGNPVTRQEWCDVFGGFHFLDEHFTGATNSGTTVDTRGIPTTHTLLSARGLSADEISAHRGWSRMIKINDAADGHMFEWPAPEETEGN